MRRPARLLAVVALATVGVFTSGTAAGAVVDPVRAAECLATGAGELTTMVNPSVRGKPVEVPALGCVAAR
ncbi:hypothetical protein FAF44_03800 [Nonomuraea sp. MG754425]|uniref:hypothetical protein n=1 Tax=Nonomuraea sp. MG754425 TaxID=2570319 RepID=UPI001F3AC43A|nr:hypothetical protein [Nonomuraea sp. MG754425]MCF6467539.1 hypothetical protein [Nonomuraea sp. MG754425]